MTNEFYIKRAIEKEAVHDDGLKLYAIQKAKELDCDTFKANKLFINMFKKIEYHQNDIINLLFSLNQSARFSLYIVFQRFNSALNIIAFIFYICVFYTHKIGALVKNH